MRLSTSPVSRLSYNKTYGYILNIKILKKEIRAKRTNSLKRPYLDGILLLDVGMRVSDGSAVVSDDVGDLVLAHSLTLDGAELEGGLLSVNLVSLVATLGVVENSEVLTGLGNAHDVHDAEGEAGISPDFVVNLDQAFLILNDLHSLLATESVVESVSQKDGQRNALAALVGASRGSSSVNTTELVQHPVGGSCHSLLVLLGSSRLHSQIPSATTHLQGVKLTIFSAKIYINNK